MVRRRQVLIAAGVLVASAQALAQRPGKMYRLGAITSLVRPSPLLMEPLVARLRERGWTEGGNLLIDARGTAGGWMRGPAVAKELVALKPDLVLAFSTGAALSVRQASDSIPIVTWCGYPIEAGLTTSLARPSNNVTGLAAYASKEVWGKFLELLRELQPALHDVGVLWDYLPPGFPDGLAPLDELGSAAKHLKLRLRVWNVREERDLVEAIAAIDRDPVHALLVSSSGGIHNQAESIRRISQLIAQRRVPAITDLAAAMSVFTDTVLAYSPHLPSVVDRLAYFIDRILRGAKPGDLPFELPATFELVVNMKAANALGLKIPPSLLLRADRVIE